MAGYEQGYAAGSFLWIVNNIYFQYYSAFIFLVCVVVMIAVSYATEAPEESRLIGLTYATVTSEHRQESRGTWGRTEVLASVVVVLLILVAYIYFNG
jgi:solute:Na+ symporter, SSS family